VVENQIAEKGMLRLHSLNTIYIPYSIHVSEIKEVWKFIHYISAELPGQRTTETEIIDSIREIQKDVRGINDRLGSIEKP
jgi:hypothetical protein